MWILATVIAVTLLEAGSDAQGHQKYICDQNCRRQDSPCPSPCQGCPRAPACPLPICPPPKCPPPPRKTACPAPVCAAPPEIPACPAPVVNLSCPNATCASRPCAACAPCPATPTCAPCPATPAAAGSPRAPTGYDSQEVQDAAGNRTTRAYRVFVHGQSFLEANKTCSVDGAYLAIPNSENEFIALKTMMATSGETLPFIGFYKSENGTFLSILGDPMDTYQQSLWKAGEPSYGSWKCVQLDTVNEAIVPGRCINNYPFICEFYRP